MSIEKALELIKETEAKFIDFAASTLFTGVETRLIE